MFTRLVWLLVAGLTVTVWCAMAGPGLASADTQDSAHDAGSHGSDVGVPPLDSMKGDLALWTGVVFLVLLAVLWKFAWGPLAQGLERREQGIADQISQAEQSNQDAKDLLANYQQQLAGAKQEVRALLEKGRRDAEQVGQEMDDKAKQEAQGERDRALDQIDAATASAIKELAGLSADLAVELAGKIVHAELKPGDHATLIQKTMADFAQRSPSNN